MRKMAKSFHVVLICAVLWLGHLHSNNLIPIEDTEEIELQIYEQFESSESESVTLSDDAVITIGTALVVIAVPIAPLAILYVWGSSLALSSPDQPESGTRNSYTADDAAASTSANTDDVLMSVRWQHAEDDLNWAFVVMKLSVGDNTFDCSTAGDQECVINQDGNDDGLWETGEFLTLSESGTDIANGATTISLYVTYRGTAVAGDDSVSVS